MDFDPLTDRLRIFSDSGQNLSVNADSGQVITEPALVQPAATMTAAAHSNNFTGAANTKLYTVDARSQRQAIFANSGAASNVVDINLGLSGMYFSGPGAFDIGGVDNQAYAALTAADAPQSTLYSIDLNSGSALLRDVIGGGEPVRALTFATAADTVMLAVTTQNQLVSFRPQFPSMLISNVRLSGLQYGERITHIQQQAADGLIYVQSNTGHIYKIDNEGNAELTAELPDADWNPPALAIEDIKTQFSAARPAGTPPITALAVSAH